MDKKQPQSYKYVRRRLKNNVYAFARTCGEALNMFVLTPSVYALLIVVLGGVGIIGVALRIITWILGIEIGGQ